MTAAAKTHPVPIDRRRDRFRSLDKTAGRGSDRAPGHARPRGVCAAEPGEVAVVLTDDAAIQALNKRWRGMDKPTNVLSFPAQATPGAGRPAHLGDIVIAFETVPREAERDGKQGSRIISRILPCMAICIFSASIMKRIAKPRRWNIWKRDILARLGDARSLCIAPKTVR